MAEVIMVAGGSSSGKSVLAEKMALDYENRLNYPVTYIATGIVWDDEFAQRVKKHRQRRPFRWETIEEACDLHQVLPHRIKNPAIILIDGVGTWVTNLMYRKTGSDFKWDEEQEYDFYKNFDAFLASLDLIEGVIIIVADEVGMDLVPASVEGRIFRDLNGCVNQKLAARADAVYYVFSGIPVKIK